MQLLGVEGHGRQRGLFHDPHLDLTLLEEILEQVQGLLDGGLDLPRLLLDRRAADKIPHFGHHLLQMAHLFGDDGQLVAGLVIQPRGLEKLPGEAADDQQRILDFMGDMGHGVAHRGQAFGIGAPGLPWPGIR